MISRHFSKPRGDDFGASFVSRNVGEKVISVEFSETNIAALRGLPRPVIDASPAAVGGPVPLHPNRLGLRSRPVVEVQQGNVLKCLIGYRLNICLSNFLFNSTISFGSCLTDCPPSRPRSPPCATTPSGRPRRTSSYVGGTTERTSTVVDTSSDLAEVISISEVHNVMKKA